jgi:hypothetical protein
MHRIIAPLVLAAVAVTVIVPSTFAAGDVDAVWVNGIAHNLVVTGPASPGAHTVPLYVIAPVSPAHPLHPLADAKTHGFGAHDHVIALPKGATTFHGACELTLVVPGPKGRPGTTIAARATSTPAGTRPLLDAARLHDSLLPLNSAARIVKAQRLRLATLVDTHTAVACTVGGRRR